MPVVGLTVKQNAAAELRMVKVEAKGAGDGIDKVIVSTKKLTPELKKLEGNTKGVGDELKKTGGKARDAKGRFTKLGDSVKSAGGKARDARGRFVKMGNAAEKAGKKSKKAGGDVEKMAKDVIKGVVAWKTFAAAVDLAFRSFEQAEDFKATFRILENATGSTLLAGQALAFVSLRAEEVGSSVRDSIAPFARFADQMSKTADLAGETENIYRGLTSATGALRLSGEDTAAVIRAVTQSASKGVILAEEAQQLAERGLNLYADLATAMKLPQAEVRKLGEQGKLLASEVLPLLAKQWEEDYGDAAVAAGKTAGAELQKTQNDLDALARQLGSDLAPAFATVAKGAREGLREVQTEITLLSRKIGIAAKFWADFGVAGANALAKLLPGASKAEAELDDLARPMDAMIARLNELEAATERAIRFEGTEGQQAQLDKLSKAYGVAAGTAREMAESVDKAEASFRLAEQQQARGSKIIDERREAWADLVQVQKVAEREAQDIRDQMIFLGEAMSTTTPKIEKVEDGLEDMADEAIDAAASLKKLAEPFSLEFEFSILAETASLMEQYGLTAQQAGKLAQASLDIKAAGHEDQIDGMIDKWKEWQASIRETEELIDSIADKQIKEIILQVTGSVNLDPFQSDRVQFPTESTSTAPAGNPEGFRELTDSLANSGEAAGDLSENMEFMEGATSAASNVVRAFGQDMGSVISSLGDLLSQLGGQEGSVLGKIGGALGTFGAIFSFIDTAITLIEDSKSSSSEFTSLQFRGGEVTGGLFDQTGGRSSGDTSDEFAQAAKKLAEGIGQAVEDLAASLGGTLKDFDLNFQIRREKDLFRASVGVEDGSEISQAFATEAEAVEFAIVTAIRENLTDLPATLQAALKGSLAETQEALQRDIATAFAFDAKVFGDVTAQAQKLALEYKQLAAQSSRLGLNVQQLADAERRLAGERARAIEQQAKDLAGLGGLFSGLDQVAKLREQAAELEKYQQVLDDVAAASSRAAVEGQEATGFFADLEAAGTEVQGPLEELAGFWQSLGGESEELGQQAREAQEAIEILAGELEGVDFELLDQAELAQTSKGLAEVFGLIGDATGNAEALAEQQRLLAVVERIRIDLMLREALALEALTDAQRAMIEGALESLGQISDADLLGGGRQGRGGGGRRAEREAAARELEREREEALASLAALMELAAGGASAVGEALEDLADVFALADTLIGEEPAQAVAAGLTIFGQALEDLIGSVGDVDAVTNAREQLSEALGGDLSEGARAAIEAALEDLAARAGEILAEGFADAAGDLERSVESGDVEAIAEARAALVEEWRNLPEDMRPSLEDFRAMLRDLFAVAAADAAEVFAQGAVDDVGAFSANAAAKKFRDFKKSVEAATAALEISKLSEEARARLMIELAESTTRGLIQLQGESGSSLVQMIAEIERQTGVAIATEEELLEFQLFAWEMQKLAWIQQIEAALLIGTITEEAAARMLEQIALLDQASLDMNDPPGGDFSTGGGGGGGSVGESRADVMRDVEAWMRRITGISNPLLEMALEVDATFASLRDRILAATGGGLADGINRLLEVFDAARAAAKEQVLDVFRPQDTGIGSQQQAFFDQFRDARAAIEEIFTDIPGIFGDVADETEELAEAQAELIALATDAWVRMWEEVFQGLDGLESSLLDIMGLGGAQPRDFREVEAEALDLFARAAAGDEDAIARILEGDFQGNLTDAITAAFGTGPEAQAQAAQFLALIEELRNNPPVFDPDAVDGVDATASVSDVLGALPDIAEEQRDLLRHIDETLSQQLAAQGFALAEDVRIRAVEVQVVQAQQTDLSAIVAQLQANAAQSETRWLALEQKNDTLNQLVADHNDIASKRLEVEQEIERQGTQKTGG